MKTLNQAINRLATEYYHETMQSMMPRINIDGASMVSYVYDIPLETVCDLIKIKAKKIK